MNILLIKIKRKFLFIFNKILNLLELEIKKKTISNEQIIKNLITIEDPIIFDVGANKGQSIIKYQKLFPKAKIYSFEPSPEIFHVLNSKFKHIQNLNIYNFAFGSEENERVFHINERSHNSGFYKLMNNFKVKNFPDEKISYKHSLNIKLNTIDNFVKTINLLQIDILKIDTEGFEEEVLKGSVNTL
jgi:FkbM family methyltransferase